MTKTKMLPNLEETSALVSDQEIIELQKVYENSPENQQAKFNYAWGLVRTDANASKGLALLKQIYQEVCCYAAHSSGTRSSKRMSLLPGARRVQGRKLQECKKV